MFDALFIDQYGEEIPPSCGLALARQQPVVHFKGGWVQVYVKGAKRPKRPALLDAEPIQPSCVQAGLAVERLIQRLDEAVSEREFLALCTALGIVDKEAIEWGLRWASECSLLREVEHV